MIKAVIDTNVVVSAFINRSGKPAKVLVLAYAGKFTMLADGRIVEEYRRVLCYPRFNPEKNEVQAFINFVLNNAEFSGECRKITGIKLPEDDMKFIEVAIAQKADYIVTGNIRHFDFRQYAGCRIVSPAEFLAILG